MGSSSNNFTKLLCWFECHHQYTNPSCVSDFSKQILHICKFTSIFSRVYLAVTCKFEHLQRKCHSKNTPCQLPPARLFDELKWNLPNL